MNEPPSAKCTPKRCHFATRRLLAYTSGSPASSPSTMHPTAHAEVHADAHVGIGGVEHDLLADPARRGERVADERVPQRGRRRAPLEEPRVGRVHAHDLAIERARVEHRARRLDLEDLRHERARSS